MCGTKAFRGLPESDSCVHFRTQARTGVSAPVKPASPRSYNLRAVCLKDTGAFLSASSVLNSQPRSASSTGSTACRRLLRWLVSFPRMRFLTLAFDLFNSRQSFYILCPLRDTDADSLQGFPRYTSLHHPLAHVSKTRGYIPYSEGAFFGCTCFSKGGCFPLKSTIRKTIKAATQSPACVWTRAKPSRSYCGHTRGRSKRRALKSRISPRWRVKFQR